VGHRAVRERVRPVPTKLSLTAISRSNKANRIFSLRDETVVPTRKLEILETMVDEIGFEPSHLIANDVGNPIGALNH
jgi:hypothetical protein